MSDDEKHSLYPVTFVQQVLNKSHGLDGKTKETNQLHSSFHVPSS